MIKLASRKYTVPIRVTSQDSREVDMVSLATYLKKSVARRQLLIWSGMAVAIGVLLSAALVLYLNDFLPHAHSSQIVEYKGFMPDWSLDEVLGKSEAVVIGTISRKLGTKEIPIGTDDGMTLVSIVVDYEVKVEQTLLPDASEFPTTIAVSTTGEKRLGTVRAVSEEHPIYQTGERVLLFLERLPDRIYTEIPAFKIPVGFSSDTYFNHLISAKYGKLVPAGAEWKDSRSGESLTVLEIESAVARMNAKRRPSP
jgi:hypothetical protein